MKLRKLEQKDAPLMLEWMHDPFVVGNMGTNFQEKTLEDCSRFILSSLDGETDLHLAIADDSGEYMGTASLKHIDRKLKTAEFAITVRSCAMGRGFSQFGMTAILEMGLQEMDLTHIYWCVSPKNARAVRFYDKNGYSRVDAVPEHIFSCYPAEMELIWYCVKR